MFPTAKLFNSNLCPEWPACSLSPCLFSHQPPRLSPLQKQTSSTDAVRSSAKRPTPSTSSEGQSREKVAKVSGSSAAGVVGSSKESSAARHPASAASVDPRHRPSGSSWSASSSSSAWQASNVDTGPPRITMAGQTHTPFGTRQKMLQALYDQFVLMYASLPDKPRGRFLAGVHAKEQEAAIHSKTNKVTYKNSVISTLARLKKRPSILSEDETGTVEQEAQRQKDRDEREKGQLTRARVTKYLASRNVLASYQYILEVPPGRGGDSPTEEGKVRKCERCPKEFVVNENPKQADLTACVFHWGRIVTEVIGGVKQHVYSCCPSSSSNATPCEQGPHVFHDDDINALHSRVPFVKTSSLASVLSKEASKLDIVALDCELVYTTAGMSLARLTVVDHDGVIVLDEHVRPQGSLLDTNMRFSGVKEKDLRSAVFDIAGVREALGQLIDSNTILVGHGLENDLKALRLVHDVVIDTAIIFPHPRGLPFRHSLKNLTKEHLGKFIQSNTTTAGHSATEDSRAALELLRWKMKGDIAAGR